MIPAMSSRTATMPYKLRNPRPENTQTVDPGKLFADSEADESEDSEEGRPRGRTGPSGSGASYEGRKESIVAAGGRRTMRRVIDPKGLVSPIPRVSALRALIATIREKARAAVITRLIILSRISRVCD